MDGIGGSMGVGAFDDCLSTQAALFDFRKPPGGAEARCGQTSEAADSISGVAHGRGVDDRPPDARIVIDPVGLRPRDFVQQNRNSRLLLVFIFY